MMTLGTTNWWVYKTGCLGQIILRDNVLSSYRELRGKSPYDRWLLKRVGPLGQIVLTGNALQRAKNKLKLHKTDGRLDPINKKSYSKS
jgi:hypothetical protein